MRRTSLTVTVSQLNRYLSAVFQEDRKLQGIFVKGEISGFTKHYKSGHLYFSLKDESSTIRAVMFRREAQDLRFQPENGMAVILQGNVNVYERDGVYQLYVTDIQPDGAGALAVAFEQTKARLAALGMFRDEHKKPLPPYPTKIGVVTSESGAAWQDIINVLSRRYPLATLVLCPAPVQGVGAASALANALATLDHRGGCDVIIIGRGGGSAEDLSAFNDEALARAVFAADTPVVSAVGHETDFTICDLVADLRAPTPSAAAELVAPTVEQLARTIAGADRMLRKSAGVLLDQCREQLDARASLPVLRSPMGMVQKYQERLDFLSGALYNKKSIFMQRGRERLAARAALLDSLSPLRVLDRGYCVAQQGGRVLGTVTGVAVGETMEVRFRDGAAVTTVEDVKKSEENHNL